MKVVPPCIPKRMSCTPKNGDGAANTSDLLFLLALFGDICP